jgi:hypothetical protein
MFERSGVEESCERQGPLLPTPDLEHQLNQGLKEYEDLLTGLMTDLFDYSHKKQCHIHPMAL